MTSTLFATAQRTSSLQLAAVLVITAALPLGGCASKKFVRTELDRSVTESEQRTAGRLDEVEGRLEENQSAIAANTEDIETQGEQIQELSKTANEALERAVAAGRVAEGSLVTETILTGDAVNFASDRYDLTDEGKQALADFAAPLLDENVGVFLEIQGHTDSTGSEEHNYRLAQRRAEAVRRHLNHELGLPLHRMSVISYGESEPIDDNSTRAGRAKNRRVAIIVLR